MRPADARPGTRVDPARRREPAGAALSGVLTGGLVLARLSVPAGPPASVWAEDGLVFLHDALARGPDALLAVYAGYAHLVPRLLAEVLVLLPLPWFGYATILAAAFVSGAVASFVYAAARRASGSTAAALVAATAPALVPALRVEALGNLANLQWVLLYAALWALLVDGGRTGPRAVLLFLAAATSPLTVLLLPGALLARGRRAAADPALFGLGAGLALQAAALAAGPRSSPNPATRRPGIPSDAVRGVLDQTFAPIGSTTMHAVIALALLATSVVLWRGASTQLRRAAAAAALSGALVLAVTSVLTGVLAARYVSFAGLAVFGGSAALLLARREVIARRRRVPAGRAVLILLLLVVAGAAFPADARTRLGGPDWAAGLAAARAACSPGRSAAPVSLAPAGWGDVELPCREIVARR